jgi:hypothetical protein
MIFQMEDGTILVINKCDFKNDDLYYKKIYEIMSKYYKV